MPFLVFMFYINQQKASYEVGDRYNQQWVRCKGIVDVAV
jgi:hypothetical protein